jgi:hypothetical protein
MFGQFRPLEACREMAASRSVPRTRPRWPAAVDQPSRVAAALDGTVLSENATGSLDVAPNPELRSVEPSPRLFAPVKRISGQP